MKIKIDFKIFLLIFCYILTNNIEAFSIIFIFMIIHEISHVLFGIILGLSLRKINLSIAGLRIEFKEKEVTLNKKSKKRLKNKIFIDLGGPISNLFFMVIGLILKKENIVYANLIIFLINILPILPLDGGRVLKNLLMLKYSFKKVNNIMIEISKYNLIILTIISSLAILYVKNISIAIFVIYLWILYIKERQKSDMVKNMYKVIGNRK